MSPRGTEPAERRSHPTILDVAERAGVSKSLVSLVMRGSPRVSEEKRTAVLRAAEELHYRPNAVARSLVRKRSFLIGVMLSDLHNPFFVEVVDGIEQEAIAADYHALFNTGGRTAEGESVAIETLLQLRTDGLILASSVLPAREILAAAATTQVVLVARPSRWAEVDSVTNDDRAGARMAVEHLIELGHRRIAQLGSRVQYPTFQIRMARWRAALSSVGVEPSDLLRAGSGFDFDDACRAALTLLDVPDPPTAILCDGDILAGGVYLAARELGVRIPEDVSVVGFDDLPFARVFSPPLTTLRADAPELGAVAFRALAAVMAGEEVGGQTLPVDLVVRESTAPPRHR